MSAAASSAPDAEQERQRLAAFRDAALRINASLDLDEVLQGVLDSARELTGGRYGLLSLLDSSGVLLECLTSGMTAKESDDFLHQMPDRWELYDFLIGVTEPARVDDFQSYLAGYGLPWDPPFAISDAMAYLAAPIRYSGERTGVIYVAEKAQGFTDEDEETLAAFASLAAVVISNARRFEGERRARADLEGLVGTAPMSVLVFDAQTATATSFNREARRLMADLGVSFDPPHELADPGTVWRVNGREATVDLSALHETLLSGLAIRDLEVTAEFPDGRTMSMMVNATPIEGADGKVESVVVAAQDLTPLAESDRVRAEYLGVLGHELRTPLAAIKGSAYTLLHAASELADAETVQFARIIDEQADSMRDLIGNLIDMARIETGNLSIRPAPVALAQIVEEARNTVAGIGGSESIVIDLMANLPAVMADQRRVVQVVRNLLDNAARHSRDSTVIRIEAELDGSFVAVSVVDDGRGMTPAQIPKLFAKFSRAGSTDDSNDLGLGLAICKGIVEAHGGRIWAHSDGPGCGSRFTFTLPATDVDIADKAPSLPDTPPQRIDSEPVRVLAIDDDPRALIRVRDALADEGYETTVTADPLQVGSLIEQLDPHVVLLDLMLPGTDGIELMQQILALSDAPVIFLSAYSPEDTVTNALETGAADYIIKPYSPPELSARIRAALRNRPLRRRADTQPGSAGPPAHGRFHLGAVTIDYEAQQVSINDRPVDLAPVEYRLLTSLAVNAGTAMTHERLVTTVFGPGNAADIHRLRSVVKSLRFKLGDDARNPKLIFTAAGVGYRMPSPRSSTARHARRRR